MSNPFEASSSALGYLYQARYALYILLQEKLEYELSIESLDDVTFEENGDPQELLQLKHHVNQTASLTDGSSDIWKTIRVWSEAVKNNQITLPGVVLTLVTTANAPQNSISALLKSDSRRDPNAAVSKLLEYTNTSKSETNKVCYDSFKSLTDSQRVNLVKSIRIVDNSPDISNIEQLIRTRIRIATRPQQLNALYERLEGWWFKRVIDHLVDGSSKRILGYEVQAQINDIAEQLRPDALPIDFVDAEPAENNPESDNRRFVNQLKMISVTNKRISFAIKDYYRAFQQRSRWVREDLISIGEMERYEKRLIEEWERHFEFINEYQPVEVDETILQDRGRQVYNWMEQNALIHIRKDCTEPYVMRGSFHILADSKRPKIGWHPFFLQRLEDILKQHEGVKS
jgi:hypothetical protein